MGEPASFTVILQWLFKLLDVPGDVSEFLSTIPFKPKYDINGKGNQKPAVNEADGHDS